MPSGPATARIFFVGVQAAPELGCSAGSEFEFSVPFTRPVLFAATPDWLQSIPQDAPRRADAIGIREGETPALESSAFHIDMETSALHPPIRLVAQPPQVRRLRQAVASGCGTLGIIGFLAGVVGTCAEISWENIKDGMQVWGILCGGLLLIPFGAAVGAGLGAAIEMALRALRWRRGDSILMVLAEEEGEESVPTSPDSQI